MIAIGVVALASLLSGVAIAEIVARAILRRSGYYVWPPYYRRVMPVDSAVSAALEPVVRFSVNSDGERGSECPAGSDVYRILMVGGSVVECAMIDDQSSWPARVEAKLNSSDSLARLSAGRVHVGNAGRSGFDVPAVRQVLERTLPRYSRLDAICILVGAGDLMRWCESGAPANALPDPVPIDGVFSEHPRQEFGISPKRLALAEAARRVRLRYLRPVDMRDRPPQWMLRARAMRQQATKMIPELPNPALLLERIETNLEALLNTSTAKARCVILVQHPLLRKDKYTAEEESLFWNGGVGNAHRGDRITDFYTTEALYGVLDEIGSRMECVAVRCGVSCINPQNVIEPSVQTFFDHLHLTPVGAERLAEVVAREILRLSEEKSDVS